MNLPTIMLVMSRFCCCKVFDNDSMVRRMEREREEGQALLRSMVSSAKVDWKAVIAKAGELHVREQECIQKNRRFFQRKALQQRRKYDRIGSFSVNMLTYKEDGSTMSIASVEAWTREDEVSSAPDLVASETSSSGLDVIEEQLEGDSSGSFD
jgi:hypothetical protein